MRAPSSAAGSDVACWDSSHVCSAHRGPMSRASTEGQMGPRVSYLGMITGLTPAHEETDRPAQAGSLW